MQDALVNITYAPSNIGKEVSPLSNIIMTTVALVLIVAFTLTQQDLVPPFSLKFVHSPQSGFVWPTAPGTPRE
jgi:hypothetical protein